MLCPHCGQEHPASATFCPKTGRKLNTSFFCTNCGAEIQESWKVCPKCGMPVNETRQSKLVGNERMRKSGPVRKPFFLLFIVSIVLIGIAYLIFAQQSGTPEVPINVATLPPPLENVGFLNQEVSYPSNWPVELRYPEQFTVVELSSGALLESTSIGWGAKLRYTGDPKTAASMLSSFFTDHEWQILEHTDLDTGGVLLVIKRGGNGSGIVVIDTDGGHLSNTIIVATIFP